MGKYNDLVEIKSQIEKLLTRMVALAVQEDAPTDSVRRQRADVRGTRQQALGLPKGVTIELRTNRYGAKIRVKEKLVWLGTFDTKEEASEAWNAAYLRRSAGLNV
jgi:hypothetical protein